MPTASRAALRLATVTANTAIAYLSKLQLSWLTVHTNTHKDGRALAHSARKYTQRRAGCWLTVHKAAPLPSSRRLLVFAARLNAAAMVGSAARTHSHRQAQAAVGLAGTGQQSVQQSPRRYYRQHCSSVFCVLELLSGKDRT